MVCLCRDLRRPRPLTQEMFVSSPLFFAVKFIKSVVSLRYDDFCDLDIGCSNVSTKGEIFSVGLSQPEIIGLAVMNFR